jgi:hypothetical protein
MREISESGVRMSPARRSLFSVRVHPLPVVLFLSAAISRAIQRKRPARRRARVRWFSVIVADAAVDRRNRGGGGAPSLLLVT